MNTTFEEAIYDITQTTVNKSMDEMYSALRIIYPNKEFEYNWSELAHYLDLTKKQIPDLIKDEINSSTKESFIKKYNLQSLEIFQKVDDVLLAFKAY